jgi:hypothetical protein
LLESHAGSEFHLGWNFDIELARERTQCAVAQRSVEVAM